MKRYYSLFFLILFCSCTQNNGNIGPIFGQWQLTQIDKEDETSEIKAIFYSFQNNIIQTLKVSSTPDYEQAFGLFTINKDSLFIEMNQGALHVNYELPTNKCSFGIRKLDKRYLILTQKNKIWHFRKY